MIGNEATTQISKGFFSALPSEKLMTIGGLGLLLSFGGVYLELPVSLIGLLASACFVLILLGFYGTVLRAQKEHELQLAGGDRRDEGRSDRLPSEKTREFCKKITTPMTSAEIAAIIFEPDDSLNKKDAVKRVKLARGVDSGVPHGLVVELPNGRYISREHYPPQGDETVLGVT